MRDFSVVFGFLVLALVAIAPRQAAASLRLTFSYAEVDTTNTETITNTSTTYSSELVAQMLGGPVLSDQTVSGVASGSAFIGLLAADQNLLTLAGATSFQGPTLANTATTNAFSFSTTTQTTTTEIIHHHDFVGPTSFIQGLFGTCQSYTLGADG